MFAPKGCWKRPSGSRIPGKEVIAVGKVGGNVPAIWKSMLSYDV